LAGRGLAGRLEVRLHTAVVVLHFLISILAVTLVVAQGPKGEGLGAIGGSARLFQGPRPRDTLFTRITAVAAVIFALTATYLAFVPQ
jgi:preprotein translocase subunit SecG